MWVFSISLDKEDTQNNSKDPGQVPIYGLFQIFKESEAGFLVVKVVAQIELCS